MKSIAVVLSALCLSLFISHTAYSQVQQQPQQQPQPQQQAPVIPSDEISDDDLVQFIETSDALRPIQQEAQEQMVTVVEEEGLPIERYQQIAMAMQDPQQADQIEVTPEEESALQTIQPQLTEIQLEAQQGLQEEIENQGLGIERYEAIYNSLQQDPALIERLEELIGSEEEQN